MFGKKKRAIEPVQETPVIDTVTKADKSEPELSKEEIGLLLSALIGHDDVQTYLKVVNGQRLFELHNKIQKLS